MYITLAQHHDVMFNQNKTVTAANRGIMPCNSTKAHLSSAAWPLVELDNKAYRDFLE